MLVTYFNFISFNSFNQYIKKNNIQCFQFKVRCACVSFYKDLLIKRSKVSPNFRNNDIIVECTQYFTPRRHDTDEKVRLEVVKTIRAVCLHDIKLTSDEMLHSLKDRTKDKKVGLILDNFNIIKILLFRPVFSS